MYDGGPSAAPGAGPAHEVLQAAGDLGLEEEPGASVGVVGVLVEDLLEGNLAVQLGVERDEDQAQAAPRVVPQGAEPRAGGRGGGERLGRLRVLVPAAVAR